MDALRCAYESVKHRLHGMQFDQFGAAFDGWNIQSVEKDGAVIGAVMEKDGELHLAIEPTSQNRTWLRQTVRQAVDAALEKYGTASTKVTDGHMVGHRLAKIAGFYPAKHENGITEYICHKGAL